MLGTTRISLIGTSHFGHFGSLMRNHSSDTPSLDNSKIIHTRRCDLGALLNTTSPGQSHRGAGASLLAAVRPTALACRPAYATDIRAIGRLVMTARLRF
jgi:hypothetical protein